MELQLIKELYGNKAYDEQLKRNKSRNKQHREYMSILKEYTDNINNGVSNLTPEEVKECETIENKEG